MLRNFSDILGAAGFALAIAICLLATVRASKAQTFSVLDLSAQQRANLSPACTGTFPR
jgi:hypothetical protein